MSRYPIIFSDPANARWLGAQNLEELKMSSFSRRKSLSPLVGCTVRWVLKAVPRLNIGNLKKGMAVGTPRKARYATSRGPALVTNSLCSG